MEPMIEVKTTRRRTTFTSSKIPALRLIREGGSAATFQVTGPIDLVPFLNRFFSVEPAEVFVMVMLDAKHKVIGGAPVVITRGILNSSLVHPREVFRPAILAGAAAIVVAHNHPSGDPTPSTEDREITTMLVKAGAMLEIPVFDHLVIGDGSYRSFAALGWI